MTYMRLLDAESIMLIAQSRAHCPWHQPLSRIAHLVLSTAIRINRAKWVAATAIVMSRAAVGSRVISECV
ncbi:hypothetical protein [Bradyrhizobium brasilense]|uniref:hypothetical protein n=1 Tax=Bradyrhizobium brasilense TaxID=1419277 RepID=UPI001E63309C|nr:hypothetical protein [Bradyrhizobium brasilense]MCC8969195.1 hypothetical protein [Bradyrhizobium brasilense]